MFPGIADRMNKEITARAPTSMKVKVGDIKPFMRHSCCRKQEMSNTLQCLLHNVSKCSLGAHCSSMLEMSLRIGF